MSNVITDLMLSLEYKIFDLCIYSKYNSLLQIIPLSAFHTFIVIYITADSDFNSFDKWE